MASAKAGAGGRLTRQRNIGAPPPDEDVPEPMSGDGYGAHPAVQQHGMAEAERKPEGLFSKTVSRLKGVFGADGKPQEKKLQRQMAKKWPSEEVARELGAADGSSGGGKASAVSRTDAAQAGKRSGVGVNQPATPERPPTVALSGMSLSGRAVKGSKLRGTKRGAQDIDAAAAIGAGAGTEGRITRSKSRKLAAV